MPATASTVVLRDVELVRAGTWDASTGRTTITPAMLDDIVAASKDAEVDHAPVKIGHVGAWAKLGDSAPALGWIANVRRAGDRVIGDLVDVPVRLAAVMGKAFRRRSVELAPDVKTPGGKTYSRALAGLALLGVQPPAVKGLADVLALYDAPARPIAAADADDRTDVEAIDVYEGVTDGDLVALLSGAASDLAAAVTAGEATPDVANAILDRIFATAGVTAATIHPDPTTAVDTSVVTPAQEDSPMDEARIRELLGIEADADVEKAVTDLRAKAAKAEDPKPADPPAPAPTDPPKPDDAPAPTAVAVAPEVAQKIAAAGAKVNPDGTVALTVSTFSALLDGVEAGLGVAGEREAEKRESALDNALRTGRIAPTERQHFADAYKDRPVAELVTFLGGLAPRFPTIALGDASVETSPIADEAWDAFAADVFGDALTIPATQEA